MGCEQLSPQMQTLHFYVRIYYYFSFTHYKLWSFFSLSSLLPYTLKTILNAKGPYAKLYYRCCLPATNFMVYPLHPYTPCCCCGVRNFYILHSDISNGWLVRKIEKMHDLLLSSRLVWPYVLCCVTKIKFCLSLISISHYKNSSRNNTADQRHCPLGDTFSFTGKGWWAALVSGPLRSDKWENGGKIRKRK